MSDEQVQVQAYNGQQKLLNPKKLGSTTALSSTSKYLNDPRLRHWVAMESLRRNGLDLDHYGGALEIIEIFRELDDIDLINELFVKARQRDPHLDRWFEDRYLVPHDLEALSQLPEGTLGREYQKMMAEQALQPDFLPFDSTATDYDYWMRRTSQTHDIEHVVSGYRYDPLGEFGLIALRNTQIIQNMGLELAEHLIVVANLLVSTALSRFACHYPKLVMPMYRALGEGERIGRTMKSPIYTPRYEEMFDWPVEKVREHLGVTHSAGYEDTSWSLAEYFDAA